MGIKRDGWGSRYSHTFVPLRHDGLGQVSEVVYLGSMFSKDGRDEMDAERCIAAGNRVNGGLAA